MATVVVTNLRLLVLAAMTTLLSVLSQSIFDEVQWPMTAVVAGVALALVLFAQFEAVVRLPLSVAGVIGGLFGAVYISGGVFADAFPDVASGPNRLLTSEWPSPADPVIIGTLALMYGITALIAVELARRPGRHLAPLIPIAAAAIATVALGAPVRTPWWIVVTLGLLAIAFALAPDEDGAPTRYLERPSLRIDRTVAVSVLAVAVTTMATASLVALDDRADPRSPRDADVSAVTLDPIEASSALREAEPAFDMFTIVDRSTLISRTLPARWRGAALTEYDGQRWVPNVTVRPIGGRLGLPTASTNPTPSIRYSLEYQSDDVSIVPFPGRPLEIDRDVLTDVDRVVVQFDDNPSVGTRVEAVAEIDPDVAQAQLATFELRQIDDIAIGFSDRARTLTANASTQVEQLEQLEAVMRDWQLDSEAPGAGQQLTLIERFVVETQRGSAEQFVTAYVLLARSLGFEARVATGFVIPPDELSIPLTIRSEHAAAWPEVQLDTGGWVAFNPIPEAEAPEADLSPPQPEDQTPAAAQPPVPPPAEEGDDTDEPELGEDAGTSRWRTVGTWAARVGAVGGLTVLPFVIAISTILVMKWKRRRRRRLLTDPAQRIRGEWANATDVLIDSGLDVSPSWTDERIAIEAAPLARRAPFELRRLAAMSTAMTFGPPDPADQLVLDALETSQMVDAAIRVEQTRWQRARVAVSTRSLRRSTQSPVVI